MDAFADRRRGRRVFLHAVKAEMPRSKRTRGSPDSAGLCANIVSKEQLDEIVARLTKAEAAAAKAEAAAAKAEASVTKAEIAEIVKASASVAKAEIAEIVKASAAGVKATVAAEVAKLTRESYISQTPVELGADVKETAKDDNSCVPQPKSKETANNVWGDENSEMFAKLHTHSSYRILEREFTDMLQRVNWDMCAQKMVFTGQNQEELSQQKQIDYTIHIKGRECLPCYITALVSLHSIADPGPKSKQPKYNGKGPLGHAIRRATVVLHNAGPSRRKITVGLTNLRCIQWYTVEKGFDDEAEIPPKGPYLYKRTTEIDEADRSLAAIFMADPAHFDCKDGSEYVINGSTVEFLSLLGSGATSTVYLSNYLGRTVAAKVHKAKYESSSELEVLRILQGVPGIPTVDGVTNDGKLLLLSPVGKKMRSSVPQEAKRNLVGLLDTLRSAHERGIVHRDVRLGNMVIVDSNSFLLIDWGFARKVGEKVSFKGSLLTASPRVMQCYEQGVPMVYYPADDLISFVKSLYLLGHGSFHRELHKVDGLQALSQEMDIAKLAGLWECVIKDSVSWKIAMGHAEKLSYDNLKEWVAQWAMDHCP